MKRNRFLILSLVILVLSVGLFFYFYRVKQDNFTDLTKAIPKKFAFYIETENPLESWEKLQNNKNWLALSKHKDWEYINEQAQFLDSTIRKNKFWFNKIGKKRLIVSAHTLPYGKYDFLYLIDLGKISKFGLIDRAFSEAIKTAGFSSKNYNIETQKIYEFTENKKGYKIYSYQNKNILAISFSSEIIMESIKVLSNNDWTFKNKYQEINEKLGRSPLKLVINQQSLLPFIEANGLKTESFSAFLKQHFYTGLELDLQKDKFLFKGFGNYDDSTSSYFRAVLHSGDIMLKSHEIASDRTAFFVNLGFQNFQMFYDELLEQNETNQIKSRLEQMDRQLQSFLKISLNEHFLSWIGDEISLCQLSQNRFNTENKPETIAIVKTKNRKLAENKLLEIQDKIKKRTPAKFKHYQYKTHQIYYLEIKGLFKSLFGKLFQKIQKPYYVILDDFVLFSDNPSTLIGFIEDYENQKTLANSISFTAHKEIYKQSSSVFVYSQLSSAFSLFKDYYKGNLNELLNNNKNYIEAFGVSSLSLNTASNNLFEINFRADFEEYKLNNIVARNDDSIFIAEIIDVDQTLKLLDSTEQFILQEIEKGVYKRYYPNTKNILIEAETDEGLLNGWYKEYYENDQLKVKGKYKRGRKKGKWVYYNQDGDLIEKKRY